MVDLRPLLFINFLLLMLLITAGFVQVDDNNASPGSETPETWVADSKPSGQAEPEDLSDRLKSANEAKKMAPPTEQTETTPLEQSADQRLSVEEAEIAVFADEAIFADKVLPPHKDPSSSALIEQYSKADKPDQPMVISYSNTPKKSPLTTGKLIVRSNVHDDTVLVNGKPYGPTRLELELTPGSYTIEVAKDGYNSWTTQVDVHRGLTQSLNARLEHYTTVEYVNGKWLNDIMTGEGSYQKEGELIYNGSFINGKFHGEGSVRYANGMKYQGQWFEGKMKGQGSLTTAEGDTYIGEMNDNKFNGEGTLTKATGDIYSGFWIEGVLNGQGSLTTKDGLLYVGGFSDNLFHGSGSLTYPDGGQYEGSFSNGMFHGKGVEIYANGKKYVGQFIDGLYHGKGEILNPNGSKITGTFKDGNPFGKATLTTAEGEVFTARSSEPGVCYRLKSYRATECPKLEGW